MPDRAAIDVIGVAPGQRQVDADPTVIGYSVSGVLFRQIYSGCHGMATDGFNRLKRWFGFSEKCEAGVSYRHVDVMILEAFERLRILHSRGWIDWAFE